VSAQEAASGFWLDSGVVCFTGGHLLQVAITAVLVAVFIIMAGLFALLVFDSSPLSVNPTAKAHGRADAVFLSCKIVLVVLVEVWPIAVTPWVLAVVILVTGLLWSGAFLATMPYYHHHMYAARTRPKAGAVG
jgi:hypothetical protein